MARLILLICLIISIFDISYEFVDSCPEDIKEKFNNLTGTGTLVLKVKEQEIRQCQFKCQECSRIHDYCDKHEPEYIKKFAADVIASDRCCNSKDCYCACRYQCGTWKSLEVKVNKNGYKDCSLIKYEASFTKEKAMKEIQSKGHKKCKEYGKHMNDKCKKDKKVYICMRKLVHVTSEHTALICYNPRCVTEEWRKEIYKQSKPNDQPRCTNLKVDIEKHYDDI